MAAHCSESFADAQVFWESQACPEHAPVDTPGFEGLYNHWPVDPAGLRAFINVLHKDNKRVSYQFLHKQRIYNGLVRRLNGLDNKAARAYLVSQIRVTHDIPPDAMTDEQLYERMSAFVEDAREAVTWFNQQYVASELQFNLTSEGALETRHDPVDMLREIARSPLSIPSGNPKDGDPDRLRRILIFRMRRDLVLAEKLLGIWVFMNNLTARRSFRALLTEDLERNFFTTDVPESLNVRAVVHAVTGRPLRVANTGECLNENERLVVVPFMTRYFRGPAQRAEERYPVFYNPVGPKHSRDILFKMMIRGTQDPWMLNDLLRGELVFKTERQMALGLQALCERVFTGPGAVRSIEDSRRYRPDRKRRNPESSKEYRVVQMNLMHHGLPAELQLHDLRNALAGRTSTGSVNHRQYKLRQALRILRIIHPRNVFFVDWDDTAIQQQALAA